MHIMYPTFLSQLIFLNMAWKKTFTAYIKIILTRTYIHLNIYIQYFAQSALTMKKLTG